MTNTKSMNISESFKWLISIQSNIFERNLFFHFIVMFENSENSLRNIIHNNIQINLIFFITLGIKCMLKCNYIWVKKFFHYLEFSIFVSFILINFFDCNLLAIFINSCLEHYTKWTISNYSLCVVCELSFLFLILHLVLIFCLVSHYYYLKIQI